MNFDESHVITELSSQWKICKSKRYPDKQYFFNTFTGDAVWHLPEETVANFQQIQGQLNCQNTLNTVYPEPQESYDDSLSSYYQQAPANINKKQIINNNFHSQLNPIANMNFGECTAQNTINTVTICVPNETTKPQSLRHTQHQFKPKFDTPQYNQMYSNIPTSTCISTHDVYSNESPHDNEEIHQNIVNNVNIQKKTCYSKNPSHSEYQPVKSEFKEFANMTSDETSNRARQDNNGFNITSLTKLFKIDLRTKIWFLVLDENVFFQNLNFIKDVINADDRCRLVVPQCVLTLIQQGTTSIDKTHMKRSVEATTFISRVLSQNRAIVDKEDRYDDHVDNIIAAFRRYSEKDYKVVLMAHKLVNKRKNEIMFTMDEIEYYLLNGELQDQTKPIKILIPNSIKNFSNPADISIKKDVKLDVCIQIETDEVMKKEPDCVPKEKQSKLAYKWNRMQKDRSPTSSTISQSSFNISISNSIDETLINNNVMFEVKNHLMQENLKVRSEEWVSRFTQIMEEALNQILEKAVFIKNTPPPWTMYEACECIKRGYKNDADVFDAANKLGDAIFDNGGLRGKLDANLNPETFMVIYSYGVYLIDALQGIFEDNENLQASEQLLSKLLQDIETPDANTSFSEFDAPLNETPCIQSTPQKTTSNEQKDVRITRSKSKQMTKVINQQQAEHPKTKILHFCPGKENFLSNFNLLNITTNENATDDFNNFDEPTKKHNNNSSFHSELSVETENNNSKDILRPGSSQSSAHNKSIQEMQETEATNLKHVSDFEIDDLILEGAHKAEGNDFTVMDFIKQTKFKLTYILKFCQDTRQKLSTKGGIENNVKIQARKFAKFTELVDFELKKIYERKKEIYLEELDFNEDEYNYYTSFVKQCLETCTILKKALHIIVEDT